MISIPDQEKLFIGIGERLEKPVSVYAIGGTAMMMLGIKEATLDIDLVFNNKRDRDRFMIAAQSLGFEKTDAIEVYGLQKNTPEMLQSKETRFDLFIGKVISSTFSESMKKRALQTHEYGRNLIIKVADFHDILIMKSATSRVKDEGDIVSIVTSQKIDWDILVESAKEQISLGNETAILTLGHRLESLKNKHKIDVPKAILDALWGLLRKQIDEKADEKIK